MEDIKNKYKLSEKELNSVYEWIDKFKLSKPKRNLCQDFADGVLMAEVAKVFYPQLVDLRHYVPSSVLAKRIRNWDTLNSKVFTNGDFHVSKEDIKCLVNSFPGAIEFALFNFKVYVEKKMDAKRADLDSSKKINQKKVNHSILPSNISIQKIDAKSKEVRSKSLNFDFELNSKKQEDRMRRIIEDLNTAVDALEKKVQDREMAIQQKDAHIRDLSLKLQQKDGDCVS